MTFPRFSLFESTAFSFENARSLSQSELPSKADRHLDHFTYPTFKIEAPLVLVWVTWPRVPFLLIVSLRLARLLVARIIRGGGRDNERLLRRWLQETSQFFSWETTPNPWFRNFYTCAENAASRSALFLRACLLGELIATNYGQVMDWVWVRGMKRGGSTNLWRVGR